MNITAAEIYANAVSDGASGANAVIAAAFSKEVFGRKLTRLKYANEADEYKDVMQHFRWIAIGKSRKWGCDIPGASKLAKQVLDYWLTPICPTCIGRGAIQVPDTPHLDAICPSCRGSKVRAIPCSHESEWEPRAKALLEELEAAFNRFGGKTARILFNHT